jgi:hypothetical protein
MRYENVIVRGVQVTVGFTADGALGDPPDITVEEVLVGTKDIIDLISDQVLAEIVSELDIVRAEQGP